MQFDIFFSICQAEVDGVIPSERQMFNHFFEQVDAADALGYGTAWLAESHLSCAIQKQGPNPVIPQFKGEIGLNTDVLLLASRIFSRTKNLHVGSAIRSILVNGGPIAHAEAVRTFMTLHTLDPGESRTLHLGFAAGRFPFSSEPYGIKPRQPWEALCWPAVKSKIFLEATEIFLKLLRGDVISSDDVAPQWITASDLQGSSTSWEQLQDTARSNGAKVLHAGERWQGLVTEQASIVLPPRWTFNRLAIVPREAPLALLELLIGSHDPAAQILANRLMPCGVFNLSITPGHEIERTHERMGQHYFWSHTPPAANDKAWGRSKMPRTVLIFLEPNSSTSTAPPRRRALDRANEALRAYWQALEGTLDERRIAQAVDNALIGNPSEVACQIRERFHPDDRLMLWFDFYNHDSAAVIRDMESFQKEVVPLL